MLICPKCSKQMHPVCGNKTCKCRTSIPANELPMKNKALLFGFIKVPNNKFVSFLWYLYVNWFEQCPGPNFIFELEECPYCGYTNSIDYWEERGMEVLDKLYYA
jgi:hypothetical protein